MAGGVGGGALRSLPEDRYLLSSPVDLRVALAAGPRAGSARIFTACKLHRTHTNSGSVLVQRASLLLLLYFVRVPTFRQCVCVKSLIFSYTSFIEKGLGLF